MQCLLLLLTQPGNVQRCITRSRHRAPLITAPLLASAIDPLRRKTCTCTRAAINAVGQPAAAPASVRAIDPPCDKSRTMPLSKPSTKTLADQDRGRRVRWARARALDGVGAVARQRPPLPVPKFALLHAVEETRFRDDVASMAWGSRCSGPQAPFTCAWPGLTRRPTRAATAARRASRRPTT